MSTLTKKHENLLEKLAKYKSKVLDIQTQLLDLEYNNIKLKNKNIIDTMTLSQQQLKVVNSNDKHTLVIACPGSGKTHTLVSMYIKMTADDIDPDSVIMITFTHKAGEEMCGRLSTHLTKMPYYVGSLHGLAFKILQEYSNTKETQNIIAMDEKDTIEMLKDICDTFIKNNNNGLLSMETNNYNSVNDFELIKNKIGKIIDLASTIYPFNLEDTLKKENLYHLLDKFNMVYDKYTVKKRSEGLLDFNDLMIMFCDFLNDPISDEFKKKIKVLFFDEYQDINPIQHYIVCKLKDYMKVMVVGDDAQSIYSFRGSSVDYILNFAKDFSTNVLYLLEENYRSTVEVVNFCQNIICKNINQYPKNVTALTNGRKPTIVGFEEPKICYDWIIQDILKNKNRGVPLSNMVVLARFRKSLDNIEIELLKHDITVIKQSELSILDKQHVKDFLAFIVILINSKSSIHWKRILALHMDVNSAHDFIERNSNNNVRDSIRKNKNSQFKYANQLKELDNILTSVINNTSDVSKAQNILYYLEQIWHKKEKSNSKSFSYDFTVEEKVKDIQLLISMISQTGDIHEFVNNISLNQTQDSNMENTLYLSTIHGSKGLEWDNVYIIDVDSNRFPMISPKYYIYDLLQMEEERRLLYVASSRAKSRLIITYIYCFNPTDMSNMSPFIREIDTSLYKAINMDYTLYNKSGVVSGDIYNYLKYIGHASIYPKIKDIKTAHILLHQRCSIPSYLSKYKNTNNIMSNYMLLLTYKMIQLNFPDNITNFNLPNKYGKTSDKIKYNYIDNMTDWRNLHDDIYNISTSSMKDDSMNELLLYLKDNNMNEYYTNVNNSIKRFINELKPTEIYTRFNITHGNVKGEIDFTVDNTLIMIKPQTTSSMTLMCMLESIVYVYGASKKNKMIDNIMIYNPLLGEIDSFSINKALAKEITGLIYKSN